MAGIANKPYQNIRSALISLYGPASPEYELAMEWYSVYLKNTPTNLDNRKVKCACGNAGCRIGLNFDQGSEPSQQYMLLTDKNGNEHNMHINPENKKELMGHLKQIKFK
jgi:hypothetical protein